MIWKWFKRNKEVKEEVKEEIKEVETIEEKVEENSGYRQCEAITKSGKRCSRRAVEGERYCRQHLKHH